MKKIIMYISIFILAISILAVNSYPTVTETANVYSWGSRGDTVSKIQDKLKRWGYYNGYVDGIYGQQTFDAIKHFQRKNGLKVDGIAGKKTLEALGIFETASSVPTNASTREDDVWLLASVIHGESRGEPYLGQVAVGAVVLNRVNSPEFPNTIAGVIYQPGAFDVVADGQINLTPNESSFNAARDALNGFDPVDKSLFYWNPQKTTNKWILSIPVVKVIGNHAFGKK